MAARHTNANDAIAELAVRGHGNHHSTVDIELHTAADGTATVTLYKSIESESTAGRTHVKRGKILGTGSGPHLVDALNDLLDKLPD